MGPFFSDLKNRRTFIVPFALGSSLALNPDFLALAGFIWGTTGLAGGLAFVLAACFYLLLGARLKKTAFFRGPKKRGGIRLAGTGARILALVFLTTGVLVSSGFAFNEIFVYWFPNFGFAFLLLGILCTLQFLNSKTVYWIQVVFFSIAAAGLLVLTVAGLIRPNTVEVSLFQAVPLGDAVSRPGILFLTFLLFVGFDLGYGAEEKAVPEPVGSTGSAVIFTTLVFILWGLVMLSHVPAQKLSETAIPHLIAARKIWGDTGRIIMGLTIIFGSLAGIHALFTDIVHRVKDLAQRKIIPEKLNRPKIVIILLTLTTGLMMGLGLAGNEVLETLIRFSLILWFLSHVAVWLYIKPDRS